jgi:hypothetical protein
VGLPKKLKNKETLSKMHTEDCQLESKQQTSSGNRQKAEV